MAKVSPRQTAPIETLAEFRQSIRDITLAYLAGCGDIPNAAAVADRISDQTVSSIEQIRHTEAAGGPVAWRVRHMNDGPHMWEYYPRSCARSPSETSIYQDLTVQQLLDILNDDKHAAAQERSPEPHAPSYLMEAFRDAWKMASEAGMEDDWEDAFLFWRPPFAVEGKSDE